MLLWLVYSIYLKAQIQISRRRKSLNAQSKAAGLPTLKKFWPTPTFQPLKSQSEICSRKSWFLLWKKGKGGCWVSNGPLSPQITELLFHENFYRFHRQTQALSTLTIALKGWVLNGVKFNAWNRFFNVKKNYCYKTLCANQQLLFEVRFLGHACFRAIPSFKIFFVGAGGWYRRSADAESKILSLSPYFSNLQKILWRKKKQRLKLEK